jgi:quinol monooxygenase YgiN
MSHIELHARMKIRPGAMEGFRAQAAELIRLTRELDSRTLRYDWYINEDGTACEVHETYLDEEGLFEHNRHVMEAREVLFREFASGHTMLVFGEVSDRLRALAMHHAGGIAVYGFFQGLEEAAAV